VVGRQNTDNADTLHLRDVAMTTSFWLSIYGVHIGATWRIRLNRPCARRCGLTSDYFDRLLLSIPLSSFLSLRYGGKGKRSIADVLAITS